MKYVIVTDKGKYIKQTDKGSIYGVMGYPFEVDDLLKAHFFDSQKSAREYMGIFENSNEKFGAVWSLHRVNMTTTPVK